MWQFVLQPWIKVLAVKSPNPWKRLQYPKTRNSEIMDILTQTHFLRTDQFKDHRQQWLVQLDQWGSPPPTHLPSCLMAGKAFKIRGLLQEFSARPSVFCRHFSICLIHFAPADKVCKASAGSHLIALEISFWNLFGVGRLEKMKKWSFLEKSLAGFS